MSISLVSRAVIASVFRDSGGRLYHEVGRAGYITDTDGKSYRLGRSGWRRYIVRDGKGLLLTEIV